MDDKQIIDLYATGLSAREIERRTGVSRKHASKILRDHGHDLSIKKNLPEREIIDLYLAGNSGLSLAQKYDVSYGTIARVLNNNDVAIRNPRDIDKETVLTVFEETGTLAETAKILGHSRPTIRKVLVGEGIDLPRSGSDPKYTFNDKFFDNIDSQEKAYWLGFMFADGYVKSNLSDVGITLAAQDVGHLESFKADIEYTGPVHRYPSSNTAISTQDYCRVVLRSRRMASDLITHGCMPRKTHCVGAPVDLPSDLNRHFIRGVCDGDGYIGLYEKSGSVEIVGTFELLDWIRSVGPSGMTEPRPHKNIYRIRTTAGGFKTWCGWMYLNSTVSLPRKYDKAYEGATR
jgi:transcriptional regulator with XRE-family HTH domain